MLNQQRFMQLITSQKKKKKQRHAKRNTENGKTHLTAARKYCFAAVDRIEKSN